MKAAVFYNVGDIRVEDVDDPACGRSDIIIRVAACGICGTDISAFKHPSLFAASGQVMGHEFSGRIVEVGSEVSGVAVNDRVTAWPCVPCDRCPRCTEGDWNLCERAWGTSISGGLPGAFAEYVRVPNARVGRTVYRLPDNVSWVGGAMVEPLSVALAATRRAAVGPTDTVVVSGLGLVGLGVVQAVRLAGAAKVIAVDRSGIRLKNARELGADAIIDASAGDVAHAIADLAGEGPLGSSRVDAAIECSGTAGGLSSAITVLRPGGRLVLVGLHAEAPALDVNSFIVKQLQVYGSFAYRTEFGAALQLLESHRLEADRLVTCTVGIADTVAGFKMQMDPEKSVKVMVAPSAAV